MSDVVSKIWLQHTLRPAMPRFRLSAQVPLATMRPSAKARVVTWLDEVSLKLVEQGPFVCAKEG